MRIEKALKAWTKGEVKTVLKMVLNSKRVANGRK